MHCSQNKLGFLKKYFLIISVLGLLISCNQTNYNEKAPDIHPSFNLTLSDLEMMIISLSPSQRKNILARPQVFLDLIDQVLTSSYINYVLLDKENGIARDFPIGNLVYLKKYPELRITRDDLQLSQEIIPYLLALSELATQNNITLSIASAYRSYDYQSGLFQRWVDLQGLTEAERTSARPGHSQHQLGTTLDFFPIEAEFAETDAYKWLMENAHRFGFSLSYPQNMEHITGYAFEPWHWRFIGLAGVRLQREFFDNIQQDYLLFLHLNRSMFQNCKSM